MPKQSNGTFLALMTLVVFLPFAPAVCAADGAAPSYPDWAAAVVQPYPNCLPELSGQVVPTMYGIATADSMPAVVAWYKARVKGAWSQSEGGDTWSVKSGGVRIQISRNFYDDSGNEKPGTRVALTRYH